MNLLEETIEDIKSSGHTEKDIIFIGSEQSGHSCSWEEFKTLADIEYDCGFGAQEIATDLIIAFEDGSKMWRHEYDGSERWEYSKPFKMPKELKPIARLTFDGCMWETLEDIQSAKQGL
jgi:hypothetical protein